MSDRAKLNILLLVSSLIFLASQSIFTGIGSGRIEEYGNGTLAFFAMLLASIGMLCACIPVVSEWFYREKARGRVRWSFVVGTLALFGMFVCALAVLVTDGYLYTDAYPYHGPEPLIISLARYAAAFAAMSTAISLYRDWRDGRLPSARVV